ncbi:MAG TPA: hypothetical protein VMU00_09665 [Steroidobacteraceae bacterium]|nr:hypothetical protein [Steroidobacteraceae bacterium]
MFLVKGRLLGTVLSLLIAALGATLLSRAPVGDETPQDCPGAAAATATVAALR